MNTLPIYIHIPFCRRKCMYCDFYSQVYEEGLAWKVVDAMLVELKRALPERAPSMYIGGGTPTALAHDQLSKIMKALKECGTAGAEFTVEVNPESVSEEKLKLLLDSGVNRLSIGLQSIDEQKLKRLGRIHTAKKAIESVCLAHKSGFSEISVDLMFGVWDELPERWPKELEEVARLPVTHISCYSLTYEKTTPLFAAVNNGSVVPLDGEIIAAMYETAVDRLSVRGFKRYEVSNFAKVGRECRHNLNYWDNGPYIGIGPSAVSYIEGVRAKNVPDVCAYVERVGSGRSPVEESEKLSPIRRAMETAAVKIRTSGGIDYEWFKSKTGYDFLELEKKALPRLIEDGLIKYKRSGDVVTGVCLKHEGFLHCDTVSSALL